METHITTFAHGRGYEKSAQSLMERCRDTSFFDSVEYWNLDRVRSSRWYGTNAPYREILANRKGAGLYAWKPLIIADRLERAREGDVVIWHDAGKPHLKYWDAIDRDLPIPAFVQKVIEQYDGIFAAPSSYIHGHWTKRRCFEKMGCDDMLFRNHVQFCCYFLVFHNTSLSRELVQEWLRNSSDPEIIDDSRHPQGEYPEFQDHRWEQSILTNLLVKYSQQGRLRLPLQHIFAPPTYRDLRTVLRLS